MKSCCRQLFSFKEIYVTLAKPIMLGWGSLFYSNINCAKKIPKQLNEESSCILPSRARFADGEGGGHGGLVKDPVGE